MFRKFPLAAVLGGFAHTAFGAVPTGTPPGPTGIYVTDPAHTNVARSLDHSGLSLWTARFVGVLDWRPDDPAASTLRVEIDPRPVRTDFPAPEETNFDVMIATSEDFFVDKPITSVETTGENIGLVHAAQTLRGETHPVTLAVVLNASMAEHPFSHQAKVGFLATIHFYRGDWGLDRLMPFLNNRIDLTIETQLETHES